MSILTEEEAFRLLTNFNCCFNHKGEKRHIGSNWQNNPNPATSPVRTSRELRP